MKMSNEAWCEHVTRCARTMTKDLIKFENVEFDWSERYLDDEPLATTINALVAAGMDQVVKAVGDSTQTTLEVIAVGFEENDE